MLDKINEMPEPERSMAKRPGTVKIVCFFQGATLGFNNTTNLNEGALWPVAYALKELNARRRGKDQ